MNGLFYFQLELRQLIWYKHNLSIAVRLFLQPLEVNVAVCCPLTVAGGKIYMIIHLPTYLVIHHPCIDHKLD